MRQIKKTTTDYLFQGTLYLISALCCTLLLLFFALFWASQCARDPLVVGRIAVAPSVVLRHSRLETATISIINKFWWIEFGCYEHRNLDIPSNFPELFGNLRGKTVRPWVGIPNRESHGQTVRVGRSGWVDPQTTLTMWLQNSLSITEQTH